MLEFVNFLNKMKKIIVIFISLMLFTGCSIIDKTTSSNNEKKNIEQDNMHYPSDNAKRLFKNAIYELNSSNITSAISLFKELSTDYPNWKEAHYNLGVAYSIDYNYPEAIKAWEKAIDIDDKYIDAYYNTALAYKKLNNNKKAVQYLAKYLFLTPDNANSENIITEIEKIKEAYIGNGIIGRVSFTDEVNAANSIALNDKIFFKIDTSPIYSFVEVIEAPKHTRIEAKWSYIMDGNQKVPVNSIKFLAEGSKNTLISLTKPQTGWIQGEYILEIFVNKELNTTIPFYVK